MNRFRVLAIATLSMFALATAAQQTATGPAGTDKDAQGQSTAQSGVPTVELHLKVLTEKLALTDDQQARIKPILQELHDATVKLVQDKSLSHEERLAKVRPYRYEADKKIREFLNDEQKKKLDQYEQGPHSEMHGHLTGGTSPHPGHPR